jgi:hypothetical protein
LQEQAFYDALDEKYFPPIYSEDSPPSPYMFDDCKGLFYVALVGIGIIIGLHFVQKIYQFIRFGTCEPEQSQKQTNVQHNQQENQNQVMEIEFTLEEHMDGRINLQI